MKEDRGFTEAGDSINKNFASNLTGLIEGDGCIYTPKIDKNKNYVSPLITIAINAKDLPLIRILKKRLGTGQIVKNKTKNSYTYKISNIKNLIKIINIINGNMRTPKINQLYKLIDWLGIKGYNIEKLPLDTSPINSNAWLAGFIDADGCFSVRVTETKLFKLACEFSLEQRQIDLSGESLYNILSIIANFILTGVKEVKLSIKKPKYRIRTVNVKGNLILINYLKLYPLFTSKYRDYLDWSRVFDMLGGSQHKTILEEVKLIKNGMNEKRTKLNWDHLENFYNLYD